MANNHNLELALRIKADLAQAKSALRSFVKDLRKTGQSGQATGKKLDTAFGAIGLRPFRVIRREIKQTQAAYHRLADSGKLSANELVIANRKMRDQLRGLKRELKGLSKDGSAGGGLGIGGAVGGLAAIYSAIRALGGLTSITDEYKQLEGQLRLVTDSEQELADSEKALFDLAQRTRSGYAETVKLYTRVARSSKELGLSQSDLLGVTETINQAIQVSGATAQEAAAGVIQLSQGLASGALRGEELNSVSEQMPRLMEAIIKGVNKVNPALGLSRKNFRDLAAEGKLTTELIVAALKTQSGIIDAEFKKLPRTVDQALTQLSNDFGRTLKDVDMQPLIESIDELRTILTDPAVIQGLQELASGAVKALGTVIKLAAEISAAATDMGRIAALAFGNLDKLTTLDAKIDQLVEARGKSALSRTRIFGTKGVIHVWSDEEIDAEIARLKSQRGKIASESGLVFSKPVADGKKSNNKPSNTPKKLSNTPNNFGDVNNKETDQAREALDKLTQSLRTQIDTFGVADSFVLNYRLTLGDLSASVEKAGAAGDNLAASIITQAQQLEKLKAAKQAEQEAERKRQKLQSEGTSLTESLRTEQEQYNLKIARYKELLDAGVISLETYNRALAASADARNKAAAAEDERLRTSLQNIIDENDPTAPLKRQLELIEKLRQKWPEYAGTLDEASAKILKRIDEIKDRSKNANNEMNQYTVQAARNMQSSLADFLFDPFKDGLKGMVQSFSDSIRRMAAEALAAKLTNKLFGDFGKTGQVGGVFGNVLNAFIKHDGGMVGAGGPTLAIPALAFAGAPRYHSGGIAGLRPDEYPVILQRGEEVLTGDDPRHVGNGGGVGGVPVTVNVYANDANSFRQSQRQIERDLAISLQRTMKRTGA